MSDAKVTALVGLFMLMLFAGVGLMNGADLRACQAQGNTAEACLRIFNP